MFATVLAVRVRGGATMEHNNHEGKAKKFAQKFELWVERYGAVQHYLTLCISFGATIRKYFVELTHCIGK